MTENTTHTNPWDAAVDGGLDGWRDSHRKNVDGMIVTVDTNIQSPETQTDFKRVTFPDGSRLYIGIDGTATVNAALAASGTENVIDPWSTTGRVIQRPAMNPWDVTAVDAERAAAEWLKPLRDAPVAKDPEPAADLSGRDRDFWIAGRLLDELVDRFGGDFEYDDSLREAQGEARLAVDDKSDDVVENACRLLAYTRKYQQVDCARLLYDIERILAGDGDPHTRYGLAPVGDATPAA